MMKFSKSGAMLAVMASALVAAAPTQGVVFGVFGNSVGAANTAAIAGGHTSSVLANLTAGSLTGLNVLWVLNANNDGHTAGLAANAAAISSFVSGGGTLMYHDRLVSAANTVLPGGGSIAFTRNLSPSIDVQTAVNPLITGPGGTISNTTLDGGNSSNHGFPSLASLPTGAAAYLNNGTSGNIVDFSYKFGTGTVYYSSIPLDFYIAGNGLASFRNIYAPNVIAQAASFSGAITEPASWAMLIAGFGLVGATLRRRRQATVAA